MFARFAKTLVKDFLQNFDTHARPHSESRTLPRQCTFVYQRRLVSFRRHTLEQSTCGECPESTFVDYWRVPPAVPHIGHIALRPRRCVTGERVPCTYSTRTVRRWWPMGRWRSATRGHAFFDPDHSIQVEEHPPHTHWHKRHVAPLADHSSLSFA